MSTIKDLAARTGISKSTISRVINNEPNVSEKTREIVMNAIRELNYTPNIMARGMVTGKLPMVLIIVGDIQNHYFNNTIVGIEKRLSNSGYLPVIYNSMYDEKKEKRLLEMAGQFRFSGIIPMTGIGAEELAECIENIDCPVVLINKRPRKTRFDCVIGEEQEAGYLATAELIKNGHTRIAHISYDSRHSRISRERENGYREALRENGIPVDESLIIQGKLDMDTGYRLAPKILKELEIRAICCNNYLTAAGVIRYGEEIGMHPRVDYEIACCETIPEVYSKDIIYAGADLEVIGERAAELLLHRMSGSHEPPQRISFSATKVFNPGKAGGVQ